MSTMFDILVGASICAIGMTLGAIWLKMRGRDASEICKPSGAPVFVASLLIAYVIWKLVSGV